MSVEKFKEKALELTKSDPYMKRVIPPKKRQAFVNDIVDWYMKKKTKLTANDMRTLVRRHCDHKYKEVGRTSSGKTLCIKRKCSICGDTEQVMPNLLEDFFSV